MGKMPLPRRTATGQGQFANGDELIELVGFKLFARGQHPQRDGQVKTRPFFFHVSGCEVDGHAAHWKRVTGIDESGGYAVARFFDRCVWQPDDNDN
jgi:hypothetical protein